MPLLVAVQVYQDGVAAEVAGVAGFAGFLGGVDVGAGDGDAGTGEEGAASEGIVAGGGSLDGEGGGRDGAGVAQTVRGDRIEAVSAGSQTCGAERCGIRASSQPCLCAAADEEVGAGLQAGDSVGFAVEFDVGDGAAGFGCVSRQGYGGAGEDGAGVRCERIDDRREVGRRRHRRGLARETAYNQIDDRRAATGDEVKPRSGGVAVVPAGDVVEVRRWQAHKLLEASASRRPWCRGRRARVPGRRWR